MQRQPGGFLYAISLPTGRMQLPSIPLHCFWKSAIISAITARLSVKAGGRAVRGAEAWILAGGAHHTAFSYDLTAEQMGDWADAMGIETVYIDKDTSIRGLKNELRWNAAAYR